MFTPESTTEPGWRQAAMWWPVAMMKAPRRSRRLAAGMRGILAGGGGWGAGCGAGRMPRRTRLPGVIPPDGVGRAAWAVGVLLRAQHADGVWRPSRSARRLLRWCPPPHHGAPMPYPTTAIRFATAAGTVRADLVRPAADGPSPAIVVLQEGLGVTAHLRDVARRFAEQGHVVLVPDLYSHDRARAALGDEAVTRFLPLARAVDRDARIAALPRGDQAAAKQVVAWFNARDTSTYFPDALAAVSWLRQQPGVLSDALGAVGFSLGGGLVAQLAATGAPLAAGVIFYGAGPSPDQAASVRVPLQGHYAEHDPAITPKAIDLAGAIAKGGGSLAAF